LCSFDVNMYMWFKKTEKVLRLVREREREREREMRRWHQDGGWFKFVFGFYYEVGLR
jgi:hypothetical protein